jgi:hypothetical protein
MLRRQRFIQPKAISRIIETMAETRRELRQPIRFENMKNMENLRACCRTG